MPDTLPTLSELDAMEKAATPGPWEWIGSSIRSGGAMFGCHILWPDNIIDADQLSPPIPPNETGPRWWCATLGSCGLPAERQAHFNGPLLTSARNALPALLADIRLCREALERAEEECDDSDYIDLAREALAKLQVRP